MLQIGGVMFQSLILFPNVLTHVIQNTDVESYKILLFRPTPVFEI